MNRKVRQRPGRKTQTEPSNSGRARDGRSGPGSHLAEPLESDRSRNNGAKTHLRMGPVSTPKLSHAVVGYFRSLIASGELQPGDALPPETELLKQLGVSRPTLREALRVLESEALIQLGRGARTGATVLQPSIEASAQYASLFLATHGTTLGEIHEVRTLLEPPLASMLAANKRDDVVRSLEQSVHDQREALAMGDYAAAAVAVNEFHGKLIRSSDNSAFDLIAGMLHNISMKVYPRIALAGRTAADQRLVLRRSVKSTESHERLIELLSSGKAAEAEEFWHRYMVETAKFMKESGLAGLRVGMSSSEPIHSLRLRIGNPVRTAPR